MSGTDAIGAARRRDNGRTRTTPYSRGAAAPAAAAQNETGIIRSSLSYLKSLFGYDDPEDDLPPPAPAREPYPAAGMPDHAAAGVVDLAPSGLEAVPLRRETSQILDPPSHSQIFDLADTRRDLANTRSQMVAPPHMAAQPPALGHFPSAASLSAAGAAGGGRRTGNDLAASAGAFAMQPTLASSSMSPEPPSAPAPAADEAPIVLRPTPIKPAHANLPWTDPSRATSKDIIKFLMRPDKRQQKRQSSLLPNAYGSLDPEAAGGSGAGSAAAWLAATSDSGGSLSAFRKPPRAPAPLAPPPRADDTLALPGAAFGLTSRGLEVPAPFFRLCDAPVPSSSYGAIYGASPSVRPAATTLCGARSSAFASFPPVSSAVSGASKRGWSAVAPAYAPADKAVAAAPAGSPSGELPQPPSGTAGGEMPALKAARRSSVAARYGAAPLATSTASCQAAQRILRTLEMLDVPPVSLSSKPLAAAAAGLPTGLPVFEGAAARLVPPGATERAVLGELGVPPTAARSAAGLPPMRSAMDQSPMGAPNGSSTALFGTGESRRVAGAPSTAPFSSVPSPFDVRRGAGASPFACGLGGAAATPANLALPPAAAPSPGFGFGLTPSPAPTHAPAASSSGFSCGASAAPMPAAAAPAAAKASSGFSFGASAAPASAPAAPPAPAPAPAAAPAAAMPVSGFGIIASAAASPASAFGGFNLPSTTNGAAVATLGQVAAVVPDTDTLSMPAPAPRQPSLKAPKATSHRSHVSSAPSGHEPSDLPSPKAPGDGASAPSVSLSFGCSAPSFGTGSSNSSTFGGGSSFGAGAATAAILSAPAPAAPAGRPSLGASKRFSFTPSKGPPEDPGLAPSPIIYSFSKKSAKLSAAEPAPLPPTPAPTSAAAFGAAAPAPAPTPAVPVLGGVFSFGAAAKAPATNLSFGAPAAAPATNLSFGAPAAAPATNLSFGAPAAATGGFSFGGGSSAAAPAASAPTAAAPASANGAAFGGLGFGAPTAVSSTSAFGAASSTLAPTPAPAPATAPVAAASKDFAFNADAPAFKPSSEATFGAPKLGAPATATPAFGFGAGAAPPTASTFAFGASAPAAATPSAASTFAFGASAPAAAPPSASAFAFGAPAPAAAAPTPSFGFGSGAVPTFGAAAARTFGNTPLAEQSASAAPAAHSFAFGATGGAATASTAPIFDFGGGGSTAPPSGGLFTFGAGAPAAPASGAGAAPALGGFGGGASPAFGGFGASDASDPSDVSSGAGGKQRVIKKFKRPAKGGA